MTLTFSVSGLPDVLSINPSTGLISGSFDWRTEPPSGD
jgi:hypothetical protein